MWLHALRCCYLAALVVAIGAAFFAWRVAPRAADPDRVRRAAAGLASGAAWGLVVCAVLRLAAQQWEAFGSFAPGDAWTLLAQTGWGRALLAQAVAAAVLAAAARRAPIAAGVAAVIAVTAAFNGHAVTHGVSGIATQALHVLGASAWIGGLAALCWVVLRGARDAAAVRDAVMAFSPLALAGASLSGLSGVVQAQRLLGGFGALATTRYGITLMVKVALLGAVAALGAHNWTRLTPAVGDPGGVARLRRSAWAELAVAAVVIAVTAALVVTPPPGE